MVVIYNIYIYICILFGPLKPELGVIPSGQENHSGAEHLNFPDKLLNKRSDIIARCRHRTKFKL